MNILNISQVTKRHIKIVASMINNTLSIFHLQPTIYIVLKTKKVCFII
jgi:hypothetical protein